MDSTKNQKFIVAGLLLAILMASMDNTIVATAMGTIVSDLGGFDKFVWVTSAYMVATMASMPIFGKLSDMYGRKRFFLFGLALFLLGSALCGMANSIVQLSIFRAIQGIGGGALMPIAFTIVFDIFPPNKRGKMTGLLGAVFGLSSVLGPLLGAYITEYASWHWIFYVNIPIGIVSLFLVLRFYQESPNHMEQKIDWGGAATLVIAVVSLMFALELGGGEYAWDSVQIIGLLASAAIFLALFFFFEKHAKDPIISFWMFKKRIFATAQILSILYGGTFIILTVYTPIFVQAVYGGTATNAGLILTPMMLGSVVGSAIGGIFQTKVGFRKLMIISVVTFFTGMLLLGTLTPDTSRALLTMYLILTGLGVGFSFSLLPIASIDELDARHRGMATSTNSFLRSFGMTLGITIFGAIQNNAFTNKITEAFKDSSQGFNPSLINMDDPKQLFQSDTRAQIPDFVLEKIVQAMSDSITFTFTLALIPIAIAAGIILFIKKSQTEVSQDTVTTK
ncbi:MDR family MFS transporter [Bacillus sp. JJ634]